MARVLCGVDADGVEHDEPNYGRDMRELDVGRWITIPDDRDNLGNTRHVRLRGWNVAISCDYLGKQSGLPFMESSRAHRCVPLIVKQMYPLPGITVSHRFCGECSFDQRSAFADKPFSFLRRCPPCKAPAVAPVEVTPLLPGVNRRAKRKATAVEPDCEPPALRSWITLKVLLETLRKARYFTLIDLLFTYVLLYLLTSHFPAYSGQSHHNYRCMNVQTIMAGTLD